MLFGPFLIVDRLLELSLEGITPAWEKKLGET